jgi:hypothetical protein
MPNRPEGRLRWVLLAVVGCAVLGAILWLYQWAHWMEVD